MSVEQINDTGDQVLRKAAVDLLTGGKPGLDYALRVLATSYLPLNSIKWDAWAITETALTDVVTWYEGGLAGTAKFTFTATYSNARKKEPISGEWVVL